MSAHSICKALIITAAMVTMLPHLALAGNPPVNVEQISSPGSGFPGVIISGVTDEVTVSNVFFNRGNCGRKLSYGVKSWPARLKFGDSVSLFGTAPCNLIEVTVKTDTRGEIPATAGIVFSGWLGCRTSPSRGCNARW